MIGIILAATLSLTSTNDYVYYKSFSTNDDIRGIGMGVEGLYSMPRVEDAAFLTEAWTERFVAIDPKTWARWFDSQDFTPRPYALKSFSLSNPSYMAYVFPESFDTNEVLQIEILARGENPSFVSPDFALGSSSDIYLDCKSDWKLDIVVDRPRVDKSYVALLASYDRLRPPSLATNAGTYAGRILSKSEILCLYTNLNHTGTIVGMPLTRSDANNISTRGAAGNDLTEVRNRTQTATYVYSTYEIDEHVYRYANGYSLTPDDRTTSYSNASEDLPLAKSSFIYRKYTMTPWSSTYTRRDPDRWQRASVLAPYVYSTQNIWIHPQGYTDIKCYCEQITTNAYPLCSNIRAWIVVGVTRKVVESKSASDYGNAYRQISSSSSTNRCCAVREINLTKTESTTPDGCVIFDADFNMKDEVDRALRHYSEPSYMAYDVQEMVTADAGTIPGSGEGNASQLAYLYGFHELSRNVSIDWAYVVFVFNRDYRAKVLD